MSQLKLHNNFSRLLCVSKEVTSTLDGPKLLLNVNGESLNKLDNVTVAISHSGLDQKKHFKYKFRNLLYQL